MSAHHLEQVNLVDGQGRGAGVLHLPRAFLTGVRVAGLATLRELAAFFVAAAPLRAGAW